MQGLSHLGQITTEGRPQMIADQQERKYRRFHLGYPVRLKYEPGGSCVEVDTFSRNVSLGGLLVKSATAIPEHTAVSFVISIQGGLAVQPIYLAGEGEIVRVEGCSAPFGLAVECRSVITQLEKYLPTR